MITSNSTVPPPWTRLHLTYTISESFVHCDVIYTVSYSITWTFPGVQMSRVVSEEGIHNNLPQLSHHSTHRSPLSFLCPSL